MTEVANTTHVACRYDVLIAVGKYTDDRIPPIHCCENDIELLAATLASTPYINGNNPEQTIVTTRNGNQAASKTNILKVIDDVIQKLSPDDTLLLVFSCHGSSFNDETFLVPSDAVLGEIDSLISFTWIKEILDECDAKFKIILVDACHSGDPKITFKAGAMPMYFKESSPVVDQLLRESTGIAYATACTHKQVALIEPDGELSIWIHALEKAIRAGEYGSGDVIWAEPILSIAASATMEAANQFWSKIQTPFYVTKVEGVIPLGLRKETDSPRQRVSDFEMVAEATMLTFQERFIGTYGKSMEVEFDDSLQKTIQSHCVSMPLVVTIGPRGSKVRLGVVFDFIIGRPPNIDDLINLQELAGRYIIDRVIIPSIFNWSNKVRQYANSFRKIHLLQLNTYSPDRNRMYYDFCQLASFDSNTTMMANEYSDLILRQMGKLFHIVLADFAAPTYDEEYGKSSFGTHQAMNFEEQVIYSTIAKTDKRDLAVDLGCGTGRHSFILSKFFQRVEGYDFSPGMIDEANSKKRNFVLDDHSYENVFFHVRDVEDEPINFESNSIDLITACFGMGSFVDDLVSFLLGVKDQLRPGGKAIFSFYNKASLLYSVPPPWRDPSLSAILNPDRDELGVTLPTGDKFNIFCRAYEYAEINGQLSRIFDSVRITSSPTFASFLPSQIFLQGPKKDEARKIVADIDRQLARSVRLPIGSYFTAVCEKSYGRSRKGKAREKRIVKYRGEEELLTFLRSENAEFSIIEHEKVRNISDVEEVLGVSPSLMAKAILVIIRAIEKTSDPARHVVFVLRGSDRLDLEKVSELIGKTRRQWRFATQKEVKRVYGLEIGGVPPFGYMPDTSIYMDVRLSQIDHVYCGVGNPNKTVKIQVKDLIRVSQAEICDITSI